MPHDDVIPGLWIPEGIHSDEPAPEPEPDEDEDADEVG